MKKTYLLTGIILASLVLAGCVHKKTVVPNPDSSSSGYESGTDDSSAVNNENIITADNFSFETKVITVKPGEVLTFINRDGIGHSVTADDGKSFDTGVIGSKETITFVAPTKPGKYGFHCTPHPRMTGTIIVAE